MAIPVQDLVQANARYAQAFDQGDLAMPPAKQLAVLTCMDARVEPLAFLGLRLGDTHVYPQRGGRATSGRGALAGDCSGCSALTPCW